MPRSLALPLLVLVFGLAVPARAEFTGEVLLIPELAGWSLAEREVSEDGESRLLRRDWPETAAWEEEIRVRSKATAGAPDTAPAVAALLEQARAGCGEVQAANPARSVESGYDTVLLSFACNRPAAPGTTLPPEHAPFRFVMAKVVAGDFRLHQVVRTWEGVPQLGNSPVELPEMRQEWTEFFAAVELCSTLVEPCTPLARRAPWLDSRFATRRAFQETPRPAVAHATLLPQAEKFGRLTGQAEACGEDVSPLLNKIERIFDELAENRRSAIAAHAAFLEARKAARAAQPLPCDEVLEVFRLYPTRISRFAPYLDSL